MHLPRIPARRLRGVGRTIRGGRNVPKLYARSWTLRESVTRRKNLLAQGDAVRIAIPKVMTQSYLPRKENGRQALMRTNRKRRMTAMAMCATTFAFPANKCFCVFVLIELPYGTYTAAGAHEDVPSRGHEHGHR
ncbi:hypothetical protein OH77DRAFT_1037473 [Trametes cingulata]|nr:hypothetical protein OH77DRAFT_1037473 [Trametes cingulata]